MGTESDQNPPPELDAIVDQVLAYSPKAAKPEEGQKRRGARSSGAPDVLFSRRKKPPAED